MPFVLLLVMFPLVLLVGASRKRQQARAWAAAAESLALQFEPGGSFDNRQRMWGPFGPCRVSVDVHERGSGDSKSSSTRYRIEFPPLGPPLNLTRNSWTGGLWRRITGGEDHRIGDEGFDEAVRITGSDPTSIAAYLTPARRSVALHLIDEFSHVELTERSISVERHGVESDPERLASSVRRLVDAAAVLGHPTPVDLALGRQGEGEIGAAAERLAEVPVTADSTPNRMVRQLEGELHLAAGDRHAAVAAFDDVAPAGVEPEVDAWRRLAAAPPPPPAPAAEPSLDQASVIADLFSAHRAGYEVEDHFEQTFADQLVTWEGTVKRVREFHYDMVFTGTGLRAAVTVGRIGDGRLITSDIDAIVQLEADADVHDGDVVVFSGRLVRVDRYAHNLFVADASLLR